MMNIKIFSDGADISSMKEMNDSPLISGLTTNPTLMQRSGVNNYELFCKEVLSFLKVKPISFEVFSDDFEQMAIQARLIASWGNNIYIKIPIMNTKAQYSYDLIRMLSNEGIKINVTAIMTLDQCKESFDNLNPKTPSYISVFSGRIADTGINPEKIIAPALQYTSSNTNNEIIWASPREVYNVYQAEELGCHIITVTKDIISKLKFKDYDLEKFSLDTVKMFYDDAKKAGFKI
jgi:transaldolase